ncbi:MAG: DICT sensory domain-containing protein [Polyangiales bacterium]
MHGFAAFSFFDWTREMTRAQALPLLTLGEAAAIEPRSNAQFSTGVRAMLHWCRVNEQLTLERHARDARVFAGFERMSRVRPVLKRYRRLAVAAQRLVVFGEHDDRLPLPCELVDVAGSPLAREWFLVIDAPAYKALLAARDLDGFGPTGPLVGRRFAGVTLHDGALITRAADELARQCAALSGKRARD